jgi:isochorismate pyruvate lyase
MKPPESCLTIDEVRSEIDRIDRGMVEALAERQGYVRAIMRFKKTQEEIKAPDRQRVVLETRRAWAEELDLPPDLVEQIFRMMIDHFVAKEIEILAKRSQSA